MATSSARVALDTCAIQEAAEPSVTFALHHPEDAQALQFIAMALREKRLKLYLPFDVKGESGLHHFWPQGTACAAVERLLREVDVEEAETPAVGVIGRNAFVDCLRICSDEQGRRFEALRDLLAGAGEKSVLDASIVLQIEEEGVPLVTIDFKFLRKVKDSPLTSAQLFSPSEYVSRWSLSPSMV